MNNCPNCGTTLMDIETIDTEYEPGTYYDTLVGKCPSCGKRWMWEEVFEYVRTINIEEVEKNDSDK